jgi:hypothetical protein
VDDLLGSGGLSLMALNSLSWRTFGARPAPAGLRGITPCAASCGYGGNEPALSSPAPKQISADIDNYLRLRG